MPICPQHDDSLQSVPLSTLAVALPVLTLSFVLLYAFVAPWIVPR